jgi:hypothetical protein
MRFEVPAGAVSAVLSILPLVIGYITTAMHTLRAAQHSARVARVSEQLKALYGPLLACVTASKSSHDAMLKQASLEQKAGGALGTAEFMSPAEFRAAAAADPSGPIAHSYRTWVREVLLPLSEKAAHLIVERADLLEGSKIEPMLLQLVAHVNALKVLVRRWEQGDDSLQRTSAIPYPNQLHNFAETGFELLKRRQAELLGIRDGRQGSPLMQFIVSRL